MGASEKDELPGLPGNQAGPSPASQLSCKGSPWSSAIRDGPHTDAAAGVAVENEDSQASPQMS